VRESVAGSVGPAGASYPEGQRPVSEPRASPTLGGDKAHALRGALSPRGRGARWDLHCHLARESEGAS
jgi:hypothetical protein